jgi:3-oxoacyl-(acyl-carrier-protein) synthase/3-hydroxymyristoyl/3-hydroxydecanoyl-(acyl carrier protein) dehydratase
MAIAIVSAGIRFPQARSLDEFWQHLIAGRDLSEVVKPGRWPLTPGELGDPQRQGRDSVQHGRVYEIKSWQESTEGLALEAGLLRELDPLFHLVIGAGRDAWNQAVTTSIDRRRAGLIMGNIALPTEASTQRAYHWLRAQRGDRVPRRRAGSESVFNNGPAALPAMILAEALGLEGEVYTLDAACASSLYALKWACDALDEGRLDIVLAGGASRPDSLYTQVGFTALQALSRGGRSFPLDGRADGLMVGEGAGLFALKRLEDAEAAGDRILALIQGIGLSNDREGRLMAPSSEGQYRAMQAAYQAAGWEPDSVDVIECHATGTPLGDATEFASLCQLWSHARPGREAILGSVKANVGHMLTAAGAAGLAKLLLALRHGVVPPTAHFRSAHPDWQIEESPFRINQVPWAWPEMVDRGRRAAISGFGFGGINAHVLLEEYRQGAASVARESHEKRVAIVAWKDLGLQDFSGVERCSLTDGRHQVKAVSAFPIAYQRFRIPPAELQEVLPQQLLGLMAADALKLPVLPDEVLERSACFVGLELDPMTHSYACRWALEGDRPPAHRGAALQSEQDALSSALNANRVIGSLGSIVASRIAREWRLGGPSFTVAAADLSGLQALALARQVVARGEAPMAMALAVDVLSSTRARAQQDELWDTRRPELEDRAIAVCVMNEALARSLQIPVLAWLDAVSLTGPSSERSPESTSCWSGSAQGLAHVGDYWAQSEGQHALTVCYQGLHGGRCQLELSGLQPLPVSRTEKERPAASYRIERRDLWLHPLWTAPSMPRVASESSASEALASFALDVSQEAAHVVPSCSEFSGGATVASIPSDLAQSLIEQEQARLTSHQSFLQYRLEGDALIERVLRSWLQQQGDEPGSAAGHQAQRRHRWVHDPLSVEPPLHDYDACQEFATGSIAKVFGPHFAAVDQYPTRVRLPDARLLLCHRVMTMEGEPKTLGSGSMITEHDVFADAWYLEEGRMPTSIAVESGQADLMLAAFLGADFHTRGQAVYRLLDARVAFHRRLPAPGEIIRYHIQIKRFFEQGGTLFFHFAFEATIQGQAFMSMRDGCAGFFTAEALEAGRGIKRSQMQVQVEPGRATGAYAPLVAMQRQSLDDAALDALREGDYVRAFGSAFAGLSLKEPKGLPSGDLRLVHRIVELDPKGGRYRMGRILGEADIAPDDWFLTCHFQDDHVMPGTLMYECCLHTLRVYLMRAGWVGEAQDMSFEPIVGRWSQLKCRGQVLPSTKQVRYDIEIKEIGYGPEPYVICDALMSADGKDIVDICDMTLRLPDLDASYFQTIWAQPPVAYTYEQILAFSDGKPSDCFGLIYTPFDGPRRIARLPRPPFQFLDRVEWVDGPLMEQHVGTRLTAAYDLPADAWYWDAEGSGALPLAILVEIALQPCGFMAAYMGSALLSVQDLSFRNLSGKARLWRNVLRGSGPLHIEVCSTKISRTGDMIIQDYTFLVRQGQESIYEGETSFGFFTAKALAQQVGLRGVPRWASQTIDEVYPQHTALPTAPILMVDRLGRQLPPAGAHEMGILFGQKTVRPEEWFFAAHFYQDPVMPGSLGLQALEQVLKAEAARIWPDVKAWCMGDRHEHRWTYRGQVIPTAGESQYAVHLKAVDHEHQRLVGEGWLYCDGLPIYHLDDLTLMPLSEKGDRQRDQDTL